MKFLTFITFFAFAFHCQGQTASYNVNSIPNYPLIGGNNVSFGNNALLNPANTGINNTAFGYESMSANQQGNENTAFGYHTLYSNYDGMFNTAYGSGSLENNSGGFGTGSSNTGFGAGTLNTNMTGSENTAFGYQALYNNVNDRNTAVGAEALLNNTGNSQQGNDNTAVGYHALYSNQNAFENTAVGANALNDNTLGYYNTAFGFNALLHNDINGQFYGSMNTAIGHSALQGNIKGYYNTAAGLAALKSSDNDHNTAIGYNAMTANTSGTQNTALGVGALAVNTTGNEITAAGYNVLAHNNASYNTAIGNEAMKSSASTATGNVVVGSKALLYNNPGPNNTMLGAQSDLLGNYHNSTAIGYQTYITASNEVRLGNSSVNLVGGAVAYTQDSDGRFKFKVTENVIGLPFIMKLRPVSYYYNLDKYHAYTTRNMPDSIKAKRPAQDFSANNAIRRTGFIAQEVEQAAKETEFDFEGVHKPTSETDIYMLGYDAFVIPLVKAVQEQQLTLQKLDYRKSALNRKITTLAVNEQAQAINDISIPDIDQLDEVNNIRIDIITAIDGKISIHLNVPEKHGEMSLISFNDNGDVIATENITLSATSEKILKITSDAIYFILVEGDKILKTAKR